jgi:hypothetical protein
MLIEEDVVSRLIVLLNIFKNYNKKATNNTINNLFQLNKGGKVANDYDP